MGFSPSVNQRILPPTFPRFTKIKDRTLSVTFLEEMVQRTKQACKIIHCTNYHSALVRIPFITLTYGKLYFPEFFRIFSSTLVRDVDLVCYRAAFCNVYISRSRIWCSEPHPLPKCFVIRRNSSAHQVFWSAKIHLRWELNFFHCYVHVLWAFNSPILRSKRESITFSNIART